MQSIRLLGATTLALALGALCTRAAEARCVTHDGLFYVGQNDTASYTSTMDAKGCMQRYVPSGTMMITGASILRQAKNGVLSQPESLAFRYIPNPGFKGQDSYSVKVCGTGRAGTGCSTLNYLAIVE